MVHSFYFLNRQLTPWPNIFENKMLQHTGIPTKDETYMTTYNVKNLLDFVFYLHNVCISCSTCHVSWQSRLQVYSWEGQNMKKIPCSLLEVSFVVRNPVNYGSFAFKLRRVKWFFLSTSNICFIFKWFMQAQASSISSNTSFLIQ